MRKRNFLYEAFIQAGGMRLEEAMEQACKLFAKESTPGTAIRPVVDSTATVINDDVKALPEPKESES
jgi:hypothetical protein